jgi:hypothetical protein
MNSVLKYCKENVGAVITVVIIIIIAIVLIFNRFFYGHWIVTEAKFKKIQLEKKKAAQKLLEENNAKEVPVQVPIQQAPVQVPIQQAPIQQVPVQQVPIQQVPIQQVPIQQVPIQQVPTENPRQIEKMIIDDLDDDTK